MNILKYTRFDFSKFAITFFLTLLLLTIPTNAASWQIEDIGTSDNGYSSLAFNSSGTAYIAYCDDSNDILCAFDNGSGWSTDVVGSTGTYPSRLSLSFNSSGYSAISYCNDTLIYAYYDGNTWHNDIVDEGSVGTYSSLAFNSSGYPAISYRDYNANTLKYASYNGVVWAITTVDSSGPTGQYTSLAFNSSDYPSISYIDDNTNSLKYAYYTDGGWQITSVADIDIFNLDTSLKFDSSGNAAISYYDGALTQFNYSYYDGSSWHHEMVEDQIGDGFSLAFDSSDHPVVSYGDYVNRALKYAYHDGSSWQTETIDSAANVDAGGTKPTSLDITPSGKIGISYFDAINDKIKYASLSSSGTLPVNSSVPDAWIYANGVNQSAQTNSTISLAAGTYNITVMKNYYEIPANQSVTIAEGANSGINFTLVPTAPISGFSTNVSSGTAPLSVSFSDLSSNGPAMWNFSFGDGAWHNTTDANAVDTAHIFSNPGQYNVNLSVSARGLTNLSSAIISVYDTLSVNSSVADTWVYVGNINQSVQTNATLSLGSGTYNVTVVKEYYTTPANQSVTIGFSNSVLDFSPVPISPISNYSTNVSSGTVALNVSFTDLSTFGPEMWNLSFGDGTWHNTTDAVSVNTSHVYSTPGEYNTTLSVSARGLTNITSTNISVFDTLPVNSSVPGAWVYVDGVNQSVQTNTTLSLGSGTYNVTVVKEYYTTPVNQSVTIGFSNSVLDFSPVPASPISNFSTNVSSGTAPLNISFTDHSTLDPEMWNLSFGDGSWHNTTDVNAVNTSHVYSSAGSYTATLSVNARGLTNTSSTNIDVLGTLPVNSSISGAWVYANGTNQSVQTNSSLTLAAGTYNVTVMKDYYETPANQSVTITGSNSVIDFSLVAISPVSNFSTNLSSGIAALSVSFTDLSTTGPEMWNLSFGDGSWHNTTDGNAVNTTHVYSNPGNYTAILSVSARGLTNISSTDVNVSGVVPVNSSVANSWIYVDGVNQSVQTNNSLTLAAGTYNVTVMKDYYATPANQSVTIAASNSVLDFTPTPLSPVAGISASSTSGTVPLTVIFTDTSTTGSEMWNLSFGDGTWHNTTDASNVSTTHVYSSIGTYNVTLNVSARGLSNSTLTTITVNAVPPSSPTGSSSGTRAAVSQGQDPAIVGATVSSVMRITGDTEAEYDFSDGNTPVLGISFDAKKDSGLVVAKVQVLSGAPEDIPSPSSKSYQMMSIDVGSEGTISKDNADNIMIRFKVSKEWIKENDIDISTIRMTRYHGEEWQDLPTYQEREEDEFIYFTAETPGFSIFNVVGDKEGEVIAVEADTATPVDVEPESIETKDTPGFTALAGILFVSFAFVVRRKLN